MSEIYSPLRPSQTVSLECATLIDCAVELKDFLAKMRLLRDFYLADYQDEAHAAAEIVKEIGPILPEPPAVVLEEQLEGECEGGVGIGTGDVETGVTGDRAEGGGGGEAAVAVAGGEAALAVAGGGFVDTSAVEATTAVSLPDIKHDVVIEIPQKLAVALNNVWTCCEADSKMTSKKCFSVLRNVRYRMMQRCRGINDIIQAVFITKDEKQTLFETFRNDFNSIEEDFRFDLDFKAEMHLRALELRQMLIEITARRREKASGLVKTLGDDGSILVMSHSCRCELAALLQAELNRFVAALHVIFDISKAVNRFQYNAQVCNALEETLALAGGAPPEDAKGKKAAPAAKGKGGKGGGPEPPTPFREPLAPFILDRAVMSTLPEKAAAEAVVDDPKAKGKPPAKGKGKDEVPTASDPFTAAESSLLGVAAKWCKGAFTVNRSLYATTMAMDDAGTPLVSPSEHDSLLSEHMCAAVEKSVWCEAERLKFTASLIRKMLTEQISWMELTEASALKRLADEISTREAQELAVVERLVEMIQMHIEDSESIKEVWLLAPDVIVVRPNLRVVPLPPAPPVPTVASFFEDKLNQQQEILAQLMLSDMALGGHVLVEDVSSWSNVVASGVGPYGSTKYFVASSAEAAVAAPYESPLNFLDPDMSGHHNLVLPRKLRERVAMSDRGSGDVWLPAVVSQLVERVKVVGRDEHAGAMPVSKLLKAIRNMSSY